MAKRRCARRLLCLGSTPVRQQAPQHVAARASALENAAFNFGFARASVPSAFKGNNDPRPRILLAEGVAYELIGKHDAALERFRQLEDWTGGNEVNALRDQARYNDAVVLFRMGQLGASVLLLTSLLGERAPILDTNPP